MSEAAAAGGCGTAAIRQSSKSAWRSANTQLLLTTAMLFWILLVQPRSTLAAHFVHAERALLQDPSSTALAASSGVADADRPALSLSGAAVEPAPGANASKSASVSLLTSTDTTVLQPSGLTTGDNAPSANQPAATSLSDSGPTAYGSDAGMLLPTAGGDSGQASPAPPGEGRPRGHAPGGAAKSASSPQTPDHVIDDGPPQLVPPTTQTSPQSGLDALFSHPDINAPFNRSRLDAMLPTLLSLKMQRQHFMQARNDPRPTNGNIMGDTYLALCTIVKDDPELLYEWIMYHQMVLGIKRFYVFEHGSRSPALPILLPLVQSGIVVYEYFVYVNWNRNSPGSPQVWAYTECMRRWAKHHAWMGFLDPDEFLVLQGGLEEEEDEAEVPSMANHAKATTGGSPPERALPSRPVAHLLLLPQPKSDLEKLLYEYEGAGALQVNWLLFGSDGHLKPPPGVLGYYNKCTPYRTVKSIVSTYFFDRVWSPHHCGFTHGAIGVDVDGEEVVEGHTSVMFKPHRLVVHHYFLRSAQDWMDKVQRRGAWSGSQRPMHYFDQVNREIEQFERMFPMAFAALKCDSLAAQYKDKFTIQLGTKEHEDPEELGATLGREGAPRGRLRTRMHRRWFRARAVDGIARIPTAWAGADDAPKQAFSETGAFRRPQRALPDGRPGAEGAT